MAGSDFDDDDDDLDWLSPTPTATKSPLLGRRGVVGSTTEGNSAQTPATSVRPLLPPDSASLPETTKPLQGDASVGLPSEKLPALNNSWDDEVTATYLPKQPAATGISPTPNQINIAALNVLDDTVSDTESHAADNDDVVMSKRKKEQLAENQRRHENKYAIETELDVNTIEELDTTGRIEISGKIAEAPKLRQVQQVQGLEELESEKLHRLKEYVKNKALSGSYDDTSQIDLSLLMSNLLPEKLIQEPDELWDAELLLTAVASDLQSQSENRAVPHKSKNNN